MDIFPHRIKGRGCFRRVQDAISLIEILVAVVIISILAALLYPLFTKMIEKGQQATCMGNLRTLWTGANLFAADNHGFLPWAEFGHKHWSEQIAPYVGDYKTYDRQYGEWHPSGPFTCPATAKKCWIGYGWNYQGLGRVPVPDILPPNTTPQSFTRGGPTLAGSKPDVVMIADSWYASNPPESGHNFPENYDFLRPGGGGHKPAPHPHAGGLNTIFVDGHIEWCRSDEWYEKFKFAQ